MSSSFSANKPLIAPSELRELQGWLIWRYETHNGESKPRKVPYYADGGRRHGQQGGPDDRSKFDLPGSFCTKRIDRNWLGKDLGHAEEETDAGADCAAAAADRGCDVSG